MPKVSVIIPTYNASKYLRETLDSVLAQTYQDFEVVVVDDGSTDGTVEILKSYGDRIRWTVQEHQGQAYALNRGLQIAKGEYFAYFDADDLMRPTKLEVQARYLDEHPDVDLVYGDRYCIEAGRAPVLSKSRPLDPFFLLQYDYVPRLTVMCRRSSQEKVGPFNGEITGSDDWDMWVRMSEQCRMAYLEGALVEYRIHGGNISFTRPKRLNHYRWTHLRILQDACRRRGKPFWLRVMVFNAWVQWELGKVPVLGERFPRFWGRLDRVQGIAERLCLRWMAGLPAQKQR
jgi:glycosyltransferase involved in cell wall biosynthesis